MNTTQKEAYGRIMQLLTANWIAQPLYVVCKLDIPDMLAEGPKTVDSLAEKCRSYTPYLYRVMRALSSVGYFLEHDDRVFGITPLGEMLTEDRMKSIVLMFLSDWHSAAWNKLLPAVQTGNIPFDTALGKPCFEWLKDHPNEAENFNRAQQFKAVASHSAVCDVYDFSTHGRIVDVGGGYGGLLYSILKANPQAEGVIADLPYAAGEASEFIMEMNLAGRCVFIECDMFQSVPSDGDCYILSNILHDWEDDSCVDILRNCSKMMTRDGKLLVIEALIPGPNEFSISKLLDLEVLVMGGGKERTRDEYTALLQRAGLTLQNIIDTTEGISILECSRC